jgi:hypothetical protein
MIIRSSQRYKHSLYDSVRFHRSIMGLGLRGGGRIRMVIWISSGRYVIETYSVEMESFCPVSRVNVSGNRVNSSLGAEGLIERVLYC